MKFWIIRISMNFQFVQLNLSHDNFFCPATGQRVLCPEQGLIASPALLFAWVHEVDDEPLHIHPEVAPLMEKFRKIREEGEDGCDEYESYKDYYIDFFDSFTKQSCVLFEISTGGMACGPVWQTVYLLFDLNYEVEGESDRLYLAVESFLNPSRS